MSFHLISPFLSFLSFLSLIAFLSISSNVTDVKAKILFLEKREVSNFPEPVRMVCVCNDLAGLGIGAAVLNYKPVNLRALV